MVKKHLLKLVLFCSFLTLFISKASAQYAVSGAADRNLVQSIYWLTFGKINATGIPTATNASTLISVVAADPINSPYEVDQASSNPNAPATSIVNGVYTWQFSPTVQIIGTITNLSVSVSSGNAPLKLLAYTPGDPNDQYAREDGLDNLYSSAPAGSSTVGVYNSSIKTPLFGVVNFDLDLKVKIKINGTYTSVTYPGMVIADGESLSFQSDGGQVQESYGAHTNGPVQFQLISFIKAPDYTPASSPTNTPDVKDYKLDLTNNGTTFRAYLDHGANNDQGNLGVAATFFARGTTQLTNVTMIGGGYTGISLGFVVPFDLGDNPASYGTAGNYIDNFVSADVITGNGTSISVSDYARDHLTTLVPKETVFIGTPTTASTANPSAVNIDANGQPANSINADIDDNDGLNDENTITSAAKPVIKVNQAGAVTITLPSVTNTKSATKAANLYAWLDFNGDGIFTQNEIQTATLAQGTSTGQIVFTFPNTQFTGKLKVGALYSRFRITTDALDPLANATDNTTVDPRSLSFASDGETEDYRLNDITGVNIAGTIFDDGNGSADNSIAGTTTAPVPATLQTVGGNQLYAYLADNSATPVIVDKATVAANGTYAFSNENNGTYTVAISTVNLATPLTGAQHLTDVAATLGATAVPSGATYGTNNAGHTAGEIQTGAPNLQISVATPGTSLDVSGVNFGINLVPVAVNDPNATVAAGQTVLIPVLNNDLDADGTVTPTSIQLVDPTNAANRGTTYTIAGKGVYSVDASNQIKFIADPAFTGTSTIKYTVKDNFTSESNAATVTVTLTVGPSGTADVANTTITQPVNIPLRANDGPNPPSTATVALVGGTTITTTNGAAVTLDASQNAVYTPTATFTGVDHFQYTLTDGTGTSAPINVTVNVAPVAIADTQPIAFVTPSATAPVSVVNPVKANDGASGTPTTTVVAAGPITPAFGAVALTDNSAQSFTYTLPAVTPQTVNNVGLITYNYKLVNADGISSAFVPVTVGVRPRGSADNYNYTFGPANYTQNVIAADGNGGVADANGTTPGITVVAAAIPNLTKGTVSVNNNVVTYIPPANFIGVDGYSYTLRTSDGVSSSAITVSVTISPVAVADPNYTTSVGTTIPNPVKSNDLPTTAAANTAVKVSLVTPPNHATAAPVSNNTAFSYIPTPGDLFTGVDTYTYKLTYTDPTTSQVLTSNTVTATINITNGGAPDLDSTTVTVNKIVNIKANDSQTYSNAVTNITDVNGAPTANTTNGGTAVVNPDNNVTYTPLGNFVGKDTFYYTLTNAGGSATQPIKVTVYVKPQGTDDNYTTPVGVAVANPVFTNDSPSNANTSLVAISTSTPAHGTVADDGTHQGFTYTPATGYNGPDTYTYVLKTTDGIVSQPVTVNITIGTNPGSPDSGTTDVNVPVTTNVKANDGPTNAGAVVTATNGGNGLTTVNNDGTVTYSPLANFIGVDTYTYTLTQNNITSAPITVTIMVRPVGVPDNDTTPVNTPVTTTVKANDGAAANNTIVTATFGSHGGTTVDASGKVTYTPVGNFIGVDTYKYTLTTNDANHIASAPITVTITVTGLGKADNDSTAINTPVKTVVKANDAAAAATATVTPTNGAHGTTTVDANGVVTYTPANGYIGIDTYTYTLTLPGGSPSAPVNVTVKVKPVGVNDAYTTPLNTPITSVVKLNDGASGIGTTVTPTNGSHGTTAVNASGNVTYTPNTGYVGTDVYTYTLTTADGVISNPITVTVTIYTTPVTLTKVANNGFNKAGDVINYTFTVTNTGTTVLGNIVVNDAGVDAGSITPATIATLAGGASVTVTAKHTVTSADVAAGSYSNQASLTATDINGNPVTKPRSDDPGTPAPDDPTVVRISGAPGISIVKTGTVTDTYITYNFVIKNTGNSTLTTVTLTDVMLGLTNANIPLPAGGLLPGIGVPYTFKYTLVQANVDAGYVTNVASTTGTDATGASVSQSTSVTNTVPKGPVAPPVNTVVGTNSATIIKVIDPNAANPIVPGTIEITTPPKHGVVKINADGTITYVPNPGYTGPDSFTYRGKDARGFYTNNAEVGISVGFIPAFVIPTLFTPNGDGINDTFFIQGLAANYPNNEIMIVNRWGNEVYHGTNYDGTWAGTGLNEGTYYYLLHIKNIDGSDIQVIKGYITLLRSTK